MRWMRRPVFHNHNRFSAVNGSSEGKNARKTEPVAGSEKLGTTYQLVDETEKTMLCSILRMNNLVSRKKTPRRFFFINKSYSRLLERRDTKSLCSSSAWRRWLRYFTLDQGFNATVKLRFWEIRLHLIVMANYATVFHSMGDQLRKLR